MYIYIVLLSLYSAVLVASEQEAQQGAEEEPSIAITIGTDKQLKVPQGKFSLIGNKLLKVARVPETELTEAQIEISGTVPGVNAESLKKLHRFNEALKSQGLLEGAAAFLCEQGATFLPAEIEPIFNTVFPMEGNHFDAVIEAAIAADLLGRCDLCSRLLALVAVRMYNILPTVLTLANPDLLNNASISKKLAQEIINESLVAGVNCVIEKIPLKYNGLFLGPSLFVSVANKADIWICPTVSKQGCTISIQDGTEFGRQVVFKNSRPIFRRTSPTDRSKNMKYTIWLLYDTTTQIPGFSVMRDTDVIKLFYTSDTPVDENTLGYEALIFKGDTTAFYFKNMDGDIFLFDAALLVDSPADRLTWAQTKIMGRGIDAEEIQDPYMRAYLIERKNLTVCRGVMTPVISEFFNTRILHAITYTSMCQDLINRAYGFLEDELEIVEEACADDKFVHYVLLKNTQNNEYGAARIQFAPDQRVFYLLNLMDTLSNDPREIKTLYINALCMSLLCANNWNISQAELKKKMGGLYEKVDLRIKAHIGTLSTTGMNRITSNIYNGLYNPLIKRALGTLKWPLLIGGMLAGYKYPNVGKFAALIAGYNLLRYPDTIAQAGRFLRRYGSIAIGLGAVAGTAYLLRSR